MKTRSELITCVEREIALRKIVYPGRVIRRQMSQAKADHEIECMTQILEIVKHANPATTVS